MDIYCKLSKCIEQNPCSYEHYLVRTTSMLITYARVPTILGLACFLYFVFCVSVKVKLTVPLSCVCVHSAWKGRPWTDLYCVGWDVKPYSLTHSSSAIIYYKHRTI